jgi:hypothetical protein
MFLVNLSSKPDIPQQHSDLDAQSNAAAENWIARRPPLNFTQMGIPVGAILHSTHNSATVEVISPKKVLMGEEEMSLTAATQSILGLDYAVGPSRHWTYDGRTLKSIYDETYGDVDF